MGVPNWALNWKTYDMEMAEREFSASAEEAESALAEAERTLYDIESEEKPPTTEEIEQVKQFAESSRAPVEWKDLAKRVSNGDFSWEDFLDGKVDDDPDVIAAVDANLRAAFREDEEQTAHSESQSGQQGSRTYEVDEDFSDRTYLR